MLALPRHRATASVLLAPPLTSNRQRTGFADRLRKLKEFQIILQTSCQFGLILRCREPDSTLGRFDRFGKPAYLGVGGGENAKKFWVRCLRGLGEML